MDPLKIAVFLAVFGLLLVIGRALARASETRVASSLPPSPGRDAASADQSDSSDTVSDHDPSALIGAEFGMPIPLSPLQRMEDGSFNRPLFTNYYFSKTDLVRGPADPECFCDEFFLEMQDPETQARWMTECTVATPAGLRQVMNQGKFESLYLDATAVIVSRWDLPLILKTVIEEATKAYRSGDGDKEDRADSEHQN
ncbi:MAG TPA: hypothetical protein VKL40_07065 [Candidatus Angelobacter sp.]|nr:hypothetical protein [Candidatus Angelobacter sp.]